MKPLLLLDLDRTLFDTDKFRGYVAQIIAQNANLSIEDADSLIYEYSNAPEDHLRHTDYEKLLSNLELDINIISTQICKLIQPNALLLPDATEVLKWAHSQTLFEVRILSFGQKYFQELKLQTVPMLSWIPADIILIRKYQYILEQYSNREGVLVDDKPNQSLPKGWSEITITRQKKQHIDPHMIMQGKWQITTLKDLPQLLI